jgi:hypothetical protein
MRTDQKKKTWATPFELNLAANAFSCCIHLVHNDTSGEIHNCFYKPKIVERNASRRIFLKSEINKEGQFWFRWYRTRSKMQTSQNLFMALHAWLSQENVRPISAHLLGKEDVCLTQQMISAAKTSISDSDLQNVRVQLSFRPVFLQSKF